MMVRIDDRRIRIDDVLDHRVEPFLTSRLRWAVLMSTPRPWVEASHLAVSVDQRRRGRRSLWSSIATMIVVAITTIRIQAPRPIGSTLQHVLREGEMERQDVNAHGSDRRGEQERVGQRVPPKHRFGLRSRVPGLEHLVDHHRRERDRPRVGERARRVEFPSEHHEHAGAHHQPGDDDALPQQPVEDASPGRSRRSTKDPPFGRLEGERDVLEPVGHEVEPQELGRDEDQRPLEPDRDDDRERPRRRPSRPGRTSPCGCCRR